MFYRYLLRGRAEPVWQTGKHADGDSGGVSRGIANKAARFFPKAKIVGHRDMPKVTPKACPCLNTKEMFSWIENIKTFGWIDELKAVDWSKEK